MDMKYLLSLTVILLSLSSSSAHPKGKKSHKHRHRSRSHPTRVTPINQSLYVTFSKDKPIHPPWGDKNSTDSESLDRRLTRSIDVSSHIKQSVCDSISSWVEKQTAEDFYGNTVQIVQRINVGGTRVTQYFYETYCRQEEIACRGIDTSSYTSKCETKHIWVYARVLNQAREEGLNIIKIRGSCSCSINRRQTSYSSLWDDLR